MPELTFHARSLRAIGQDLEIKGISQFNLKSSKYGYFVRALSTPKSELDRSSDRKKWIPRSEKSKAPAQLIYSLQTIEQLDERGRAKRGMGEKLPDFFSLSQCLRAVGAVIDAKQGQLVELDRNAEVDSIPSIAVRYLTFNGAFVREEHSAPALYDQSVHLYKSRRLELDPSDFSTVPTRRSN
jgi:hypothetical protein